MAFRIGEYVVRGELRNTRANGVFGWLAFGPDEGVHFELAGNLREPFKGKHLRFTTPRDTPAPHPAIDALPQEIDSLADRQLGVIGDVELRDVKVPKVPLAEFARLDREEQARQVERRLCLYLEWYGQNGRVVAEILDPEIEYVDEANEAAVFDDDFDPLEIDTISDTGGEAIVEFDGDDDDDLAEDSEDDDPYGLFDDDLQRNVADAIGGDADDGYADESPPLDGLSINGIPWQDVLPGLDDETRAMYEQWDEILQVEKDEPVGDLLPHPLRLPPPSQVTTDEQAEPLVTVILAQLALLSIALDVCEHYSPLDTYRLLMTEILPNAKVHPNLAASQMVQHYSTSDHCAACDAEYNMDQGDAGDDRGEGD